MRRETLHLRGLLPCLLVFFSFALCCAASDEALHGSAAPAPSPLMEGDSSMYTMSGMRPDTSRQQNITLVFVAGVSICLAVFVISYCIAYRTILARQGEAMNRLYRSRLRGASWEDQQQNNPHGDAQAEEDAGLRSSLVGGTLRTVQFRSGMLKEETGKGPPPLQQQEPQVIIMWVKECAVCLSEFEDGEEMKVLPVCGHCFHEACINKWLSSHITCPICRISLLKLPAADSAIAETSPDRPEPLRGPHVAVDI